MVYGDLAKLGCVYVRVGATAERQRAGKLAVMQTLMVEWQWSETSVNVYAISRIGLRCLENITCFHGTLFSSHYSRARLLSLESYNGFPYNSRRLFSLKNARCIRGNTA